MAKRIPIPTEPADPVEPAPISAPEPPAPPQPDPTPAPSAFSLIDYARDQGIDPSSFQNDEDMAAELIATVRDYQQLEPLAQIGRQFAPYADKFAEFQKWQAEQTQAVEPPAPQPEPAWKWDVPEYDPRWEQMLTYDPGTGFYRPPNDMPYLMPIADKLNRYKEWQRDAFQQIIRDPRDLVMRATADRFTEIESKIDQRARAIAEDAIGRYRAEQETRTYLQQNKDFYVLDAEGRVQRDGRGEPRLSPKGVAMHEYANGLAGAGMGDAAMVRELAAALVERDELKGRFATGAKQPAQPAKPPRGKERFLDVAARSPDRGGSIPDTTAPRVQNRAASLAEIVRRLATERGVSLSNDE